MDELTRAIVTIVVGITGVAILATLVSKKSATSDVIKSAGGAYSNMLSTALSPITGGGISGNFSNISMNASPSFLS